MLLLPHIWSSAGRVFKSYKHIFQKRFINQYNKIYYIFFAARYNSLPVEIEGHNVSRFYLYNIKMAGSKGVIMSPKVLSI